MWDEIQLKETFGESLSKSIKVRFKEQSYTPLPPGKYIVRLNDIIEASGAYLQPIYVFKFEVMEGQYAGSTVNGLINKSPTGHSIKCKLWKWVLALSGREVDIDDELDLITLVGNECQAVVKREGHINKITELKAKTANGG